MLTSHFSVILSFNATTFSPPWDKILVKKYTIQNVTFYLYHKLLQMDLYYSHVSLPFNLSLFPLFYFSQKLQCTEVWGYAAKGTRLSLLDRPYPELCYSISAWDARSMSPCDKVHANCLLQHLPHQTMDFWYQGYKAVSLKDRVELRKSGTY